MRDRAADSWIPMRCTWRWKCDRARRRTYRASLGNRLSVLSWASAAVYSTSWSSLNIGMYMAMMMIPTTRPTPIIMIGSTIDVSAWIEASTSSS